MLVRIAVVLSVFLCAKVLSSSGECVEQSASLAGKEIRVSIHPQLPSYCPQKPIEVKILFENVTDKEILLLDPRTCKESCLFIGIADADHSRINPVVEDDIVYQIIETDVRLVLLKPKGKLEVSKDITTQYFGRNKYKIDKPGVYWLTTTFFPRNYRLKDGKRSYGKLLESEPINIRVNNCLK